MQNKMETFSVLLKACLFATVIFVSCSTVHAGEGKKPYFRSYDSSRISITKTPL